MLTSSSKFSVAFASKDGLIAPQAPARTSQSQTTTHDGRSATFKAAEEGKLCQGVRDKLKDPKQKGMWQNVWLSVTFTIAWQLGCRVYFQKANLQCVPESFCSLQPSIKEETSDSLHQDNLKTKKRGSEHANAVPRPGQNNLMEVKHDVQKPESKTEGKTAFSKPYRQ